MYVVVIWVYDGYRWLGDYWERKQRRVTWAAEDNEQAARITAANLRAGDPAYKHISDIRIETRH